ncbi:hypothetical protein NDN08_004210 [Rhodosorus marinus]|uniref:Uncharacterized protein n=1 Tax=Rhodosorus marinus TaxID=101924 RepID=A0AAV8UHK4_9RHOD|nr:hypothetical protein NDN08_004210 [Rhodosorus marinus]
MSGATETAPRGPVQDVAKSAAPIINKALDILDDLAPLFDFIYETVQSFIRFIQPYHPEDFMPALFGFILCFFGGTYMMLTSAVEAFRLFGFEKVKANVMALHSNFRAALDAFRKDNQQDENRDGIADVQQMQAQELLSRRVSIFFKSVNPEEVFAAVEGLLQGWLAVIATLKSRFAQYIAIGASIGDALNKTVGPILSKLIQGVLPSEYDRWAPVTIKYGFRMFGVSIAWTIARVVNSFYSSIRGSEMFLLGLMSYVSRRGYVDRVRMEPGGPIFTMLFFGLAALGFLVQFRSGYKLPFPINVLLAPLSILEYFITWSVAIDKQV